MDSFFDVVVQAHKSEVSLPPNQNVKRRPSVASVRCHHHHDNDFTKGDSDLQEERWRTRSQ